VAQLKGQGRGNRKVRAILSVNSVNIITAGQSIVVGGESVMTGTVALVDARTGQTILSPTRLSSGGGGWVAGGLIAVAIRDDAATELRQMSNEFVARARILTVGDPLLVSNRSTSNGPAPQVIEAAAAVQDAENSAQLETTSQVQTPAQREAQLQKLKCRNSITIYCKSPSGGGVIPDTD